MGDWCPRIKAKCRKDCIHYRRGVRLFDDGRKPEAVEDCAFNIEVDCLENLVSRSVGNQKASEQVRNEVSKLNEIFYKIAEIKMLERKNES
jgi:hypothetical protein